MTCVCLIPHNSSEYWEAVELRRRILRGPLGLVFSEDELAAEGRDFHFLATREGRAVGCLVMTLINCSIVKMRQVAVEPELQGQGVGKALVRASEDWARERNYSRIELNARDTAVDFYLRLGYAVVGEPFVEVTIPHRKMMRDL